MGWDYRGRVGEDLGVGGKGLGGARGCGSWVGKGLRLGGWVTGGQLREGLRVGKVGLGEMPEIEGGEGGRVWGWRVGLGERLGIGGDVMGGFGGQGIREWFRIMGEGLGKVADSVC